MHEVGFRSNLSDDTLYDMVACACMHASVSMTLLLC